MNSPTEPITLPSSYGYQRLRCVRCFGRVGGNFIKDFAQTTGSTQSQKLFSKTPTQPETGS